MVEFSEDKFLKNDFVEAAFVFLKKGEGIISNDWTWLNYISGLIKKKTPTKVDSSEKEK